MTGRQDRLDDDELVDGFLAASRALMGVATRSLHAAGEDVTLPQYRVLVVLETGGPQRIADLAAALGCTSSTATRYVDRLESKGLVVRRRGGDDRRVVCVAVTPAGAVLVASVLKARRREITRIVDAMADADVAAAVRALQAFAEAAGEAPDQHWTLGWARDAAEPEQPY